MSREWLKELRKEKGYKQFELAEKVGVSNRTISNIETGRKNPSGKLAKRISELLGFDMKLFYEDDKKIS